MLTKCVKKKLNGNKTIILCAVLNKLWKQHPTKQQLYNYLPSISQTIQIRQTRHAGYCWRREDKLISDILQWILVHGRASVDWLPKCWHWMQPRRSGVMNDRDGWQERVKRLCPVTIIWWWLINCFIISLFPDKKMIYFF